MSLDQFKDAMKNRVLLLSSTALQEEILALQDSVGKTRGKAGSMERASSLLLVDKVPTKGARGISAFRVKGMKAANTVLVVTEANLQMHWRYYNLNIPSINNKKVIPGSVPMIDSDGVIQSANLLSYYITWVTGGKGKDLTNKRNKKIAANQFEYYTSTSKVISKTAALNSFKSDDENEVVTAIRQTNIPHTATNTQIWKFLVHCGLNERQVPESKYKEDWQVGHIESQSHGKLSISAQDANVPGTVINKLLTLHKYLDLASSSLTPKYAALEASILKDFTGRHIRMNVEMQPTGYRGRGNPLSNQGSGFLSAELEFSKILTSLVAIDPSEKSRAKYRQLAIDTDIIAEGLAKLYSNYMKNRAEVRLALESFSRPGVNIPQFLMNLESSDSIVTHSVKLIKAAIKGTKAPTLNIKHDKVPIIKLKAPNTSSIQTKVKQASSRLKSNLEELKKNNAKKSSSANSTAGPAANLNIPNRGTIGSSYSLTSLQTLINLHLQSVISANMGDEGYPGGQRRILNYQTGRFAASANVERMSQSRAGMVTAYYSYMKNPYQAFEPGFSQGSPTSRDPKLLISKSIREIAAIKVGNKLRAVSI